MIKKEEADVKDVVHSEDSKKSFLAKLEKAKKERKNVEVVTGLSEGEKEEASTPKIKLTSYIAKGQK